ncbi:MAG: SpaH/EbpB family LPXTG-anchored major pilin [Tissierellia bacterium]|nr:SpaH/EbpB family LPXTG-anchored major pilin [Tissierellia bacterium]
MLKKLRRIYLTALSLLMFLSIALPQRSKAAEGAYYYLRINKIALNENDINSYDTNKEYDPKNGIEDLKTHFGQSAESVGNAVFLVLSQRQLDELKSDWPAAEARGYKQITDEMMYNDPKEFARQAMLRINQLDLSNGEYFDLNNRFSSKYFAGKDLNRGEKRQYENGRKKRRNDIVSALKYNNTASPSKTDEGGALSYTLNEISTSAYTSSLLNNLIVTHDGGSTIKILDNHYDFINDEPGKEKETFYIVEIPQLSQLLVDGKWQTPTKSVATATKISVPFTYPDGSLQKSQRQSSPNVDVDLVNIYPKNQYERPSVEKRVLDEDNKPSNSLSVDLNKAHTWEISTPIDQLIKNYNVLRFKDEIDPRLDFIEDSVKYIIKDDNSEEKIDSSYFTTTKPTAENNKTLTVEVDRKKLTNEIFDNYINTKQNPRLVIRYKTKINDTAEVDSEIPNNVDMEFSNNPNQEIDSERNPKTPEVHTGGARFEKVDGTNKEMKLEGAKFVVKKTDGEKTLYLKEDNTWKEDVADAKADSELKILTSGENGEFEVKGLAYGDYQLEEIKAPEGYQLNENTNAIDFNIQKQTYEGKLYAIENNKGGEIPNTGGIGTVIFTVVGVVLMGTAFYFIKKKNAQN